MTIQDLQFELIERTAFNAFDGPRVANGLRARRGLWTGVMFGRFRGSTLLPLRSKLVHCRWSGEGCWIPLGDFKLDVGFENHTSHPAPGEILWYPGGISETELIFAYGDVSFSSKVGQLAGNHFLTVVEGAAQLAEMGRRVLYHGAQEIVFG